nr:MAG TPA_asm: hypothetical protein [Caudoviricetes sp.]
MHTLSLNLQLVTPYGIALTPWSEFVVMLLVQTG